MILYSLKCSKGHSFDSWFKSAAAFDTLNDSGHLTCAVCGDTRIEKALMAPQVRPARQAAAGPAGPTPPAAAAPARPETPGRLAPRPDTPAAELARIRRAIEKNSEYVGVSFVTEARRIHQGDAPERPIHGEARLDEARALIEEGVPIAPLPFLPGRKAN